jgi:hypothetical protein
MKSKPKVKSIYPKDKPSFNEWCSQFKVSSLYTDRQGINNAQRIMSLWDGYTNTKQFFVKPLTIKL